MTIATNITLLRIAMIPVFIIVFYLPFTWSNAAAAAIFALASFTDWLDGYMARRMQQTSEFGAFLDPVADKLMVAVVLVLLVQADPTPLLAIPAAIILGREIAVSALREWMAELGKRTNVAVSVVGKFKTFAQMLALILLLYHEPIAGLSTRLLGFVFLYVAAGLTLWSMTIYLYTAWPDLSAKS
jgi:CDP-diacylglycerol--glycerol-3-phosphate 3-phosphatidyltransferase